MSFKTQDIDPSQVEKPTVLMTKRAQDQYRLIVENDITLEDCVFRLEVSGKGCDGFTYAAGFTDKRNDDFLVQVANSKQTLIVALDPFAAYYLQETSIDFIQDFAQDAEGFVIINLRQENFQGKFWRARPELTPPLKTDQNKYQLQGGKSDKGDRDGL